MAPSREPVHALVVPPFAGWFRSIGIGVSLQFDQGIEPIFIPDSVLPFELQHGKELERYRHNDECVAWARREHRPLLAEHAGFYDLFVPVGARPRGMLFSGPFAIARSSAADIQRRWRWLTGHKGTLGNTEFTHYVEATLSMPVLEGRLARMFEQLLGCFARLLDGQGDALALRREAERLRDELEVVSRVARTWDIAAGMVDNRTARSWSSQHRAAELRGVGVHKLPDHVLVGLTVARPVQAADPIDELMRRCGFQRACAELASGVDNLVFGRLGDHGVFLLVPGAGSAARRNKKLSDLAREAIAMAASRFHLELYVGIGPVPSPAPLSFQFEAALAAAEAALARGEPVLHAERASKVPAVSLGEMRRELAALVENQPRAAAPRFERYVEAVAARCGYAIAPVRAHLDAGFERMVEVLTSAGAIEPRSVADMLATLDASASDARTIAELFAAFRPAVARLIESVERPVRARRDRSLRRALALIHERCTDSDLTLARVARAAGYSPSHFREVFQQAQATTFARYVRQQRLERAKQLLTTTDLTVERVAQLSGFGETHYFHRAFKTVVGSTPRAYREYPGGPPALLIRRGRRARRPS